MHHPQQKYHDAHGQLLHLLLNLHGGSNFIHGLGDPCHLMQWGDTYDHAVNLLFHSPHPVLQAPVLLSLYPMSHNHHHTHPCSLIAVSVVGFHYSCSNRPKVRDGSKIKYKQSNTPAQLIPWPTLQCPSFSS